MTLSIIIVNYKSEQLIQEALASFLPESVVHPEIIIVEDFGDYLNFFSNKIGPGFS